jgi:aspartyl protease family protein
MVMARQVAVWLVGMMVLVAVYGYRFELKAVGERVLAELMPGRGQTLDARTVSFRRGAGRQFWIDAEVGGRPVRFLVDTGASGVVLTRADAARLGFAFDALRFTQHFNTANGATRGAPVRLRDLRIGPWTFPELPASVNEGVLEHSLLGMRFLDQLGSLEISKDTLTLRR